MEKQVIEYAGGNEIAAIAIKQIGYDLMGYYPITPSTQIAENLDDMRARGETDLIMIAAEGEHSAAGICYGASVGGGRVINATSANGLLYALEQFPVQSGTRYPMVMNVACRTVSGPLSIKGDHSDIMYLLNAGWPILFAHTVQQVYDFNIIACVWQNKSGFRWWLHMTVFLPAIKKDDVCDLKKMRQCDSLLDPKKKYILFWISPIQLRWVLI